jgi:hypothetical protein
MKQATGSSPSVAEVLYQVSELELYNLIVRSALFLQSARDCFELFIAVVPSKFSDVIDTVPRMGAVYVVTKNSAFKFWFISMFNLKSDSTMIVPIFATIAPSSLMHTDR